MPAFLIATRNTHKAAEVRQLLEVDCLALDAFPGAPVIAETADTFAGNATLKARGLAQWQAEQVSPITHVLADDSGLEVDALNGAPGVHSARFASVDATNSSDTANNTKLIRLLASYPPAQRTARFRCVIALVEITHPKNVHLFEGVCEGTIAEAPAGEHGFGYDPLFMPESHRQTFAELGNDLKNQLSHRAAALARLKASV